MTRALETHANTKNMGVREQLGRDIGMYPPDLKEQPAQLDDKKDHPYLYAFLHPTPK